MKKFIATIHHLGFYWPSEQENYGKTTLTFNEEDCRPLYGDKPMEGENYAEVVFDLCGNPSKRPEILKKEGQCYTLSVGDVVVIEEKETKEKKNWLCLPCGWMEVRRSEIAYLAGKVEEAAETYGGRWEVGYKGKDAILARRKRQAAKLAGPGAGGHRE